MVESERVQERIKDMSEEHYENLKYRDWCKTPEGKKKLAELRKRKTW